MNRHLTPLAAALLAAFSAPAVFAQTAPTETTLPAVTVQAGDQTYNPITATSATKIEAPLRDIPQTINVVPQQVMRDKGVRSMEDAVKSIPGIGLTHGDGQRDQVTIRGFAALGDQFVDGIRDDAMYFRDMSNVEQIEVVKGPASVLYGRGSSGGLINRVTKKPGMDKNEVTVQVGSWNQRRGEFDFAQNYEDKGIAFRVTGALEKADSYRDQQFLDREALAPSLLIKLGADTKLLLQADYLSDRRVTDFGIPSYMGLPANVPASNYYGAADAKHFDYVQSRMTSVGFTLDHRFNSEWSIRNAFRHYDYSLQRYSTTPGNAVLPAQTSINLNRGSILREEDGYFNQTELVQKTTLAGMQHQILYGVEIGKQNKDQVSRSIANFTTISIFNPVNPIITTLPSNAPTTDNLGILTTASAYVQDMVTLSEKWKALVGVRYDSFEQETRQRIAGQPNLNRTDKAWSPRAGLVYQPTTTQSYYGSLSKSFQPSGETLPLATNNSQLAPEETTSREVGAKFDLFDGKASATASLFRLERSNIKMADGTGTTLIPIGKQRTDGLELTFTGDLSNGWQVFSGYAYLDAVVTDSPTISTVNGVAIPLQGKNATLTPKHSANVWLTKSLGFGFTAGAGINYVGDRFADPTNTVTLPSYTTMDAMVSYKIKGFDLQLNIFNIFDKDYIASAHSSLVNSLMPGAPRSATLTARYAF